MVAVTMNQNVIFISPCELAFVRKTGPYPLSSVAAWKVILDWLANEKHDVIGEVGYGIAVDDPRTKSAEHLRYDACIRKPVTISAADHAIVSVQLFNGGAYFSTRHVGSYSALGRVVAEARDVLVPREGLIHDLSRPVLTMNYSYPEKTAPGNQIADICIPVVPDRRFEQRD